MEKWNGTAVPNDAVSPRLNAAWQSYASTRHGREEKKGPKWKRTESLLTAVSVTSQEKAPRRGALLRRRVFTVDFEPLHLLFPRVHSVSTPSRRTAWKHPHERPTRVHGEVRCR